MASWQQRAEAHGKLQCGHCFILVLREMFPMVLSQTSIAMQRDGRSYGGLGNGYIAFSTSPVKVCLHLKYLSW